jgi:hypothetical protein
MANTVLVELGKKVRGRLVDSVRFTEADAAIIAKFKDQLLALTPEIGKAFYEGLFANPATAAVFKEGERPAREKTLADWWQRTITGPVDDAYWGWQAYVGLIHVKRQVSNAMMIGQTTLIRQVVADRFPNEPGLVAAVGRLLGEVAAVIADSYEVMMQRAMEKFAGISHSLVIQQVALGVDELFSELK